MRALDPTGADAVQCGILHGFFFLQITARRRAVLDAFAVLQIGRTAQTQIGIVFIHRFAQQDDDIAFILEPLRGDMFLFLDQTDNSDRGGRVDRSVRILIVKTDIAACDRCAKDIACLCQTSHRFLELIEQFRMMRIAEIEIIRTAQRDRSGAGQIAGAFCHHRLAAFIGIQIDISAIAVHCHSDIFFGSGGNGLGLTFGQHRQTVGLDAHHGGIGTGADHGTIAHLMIVLAIDPVLGSDRRNGQQSFQILRHVRGILNGADLKGANVIQIFRFFGFAVIDRRIIGDLGCRNVGYHFAVIADDHAACVRDHADLRPGQIPFVKDALHFGFVTFVDDDEHTFLRFAQHDLIGCHAGGALRYFAQLDLDAGAGAGRGFAGGTGQACRAHILDAGNSVLGGQQFQTGFHDQFFHERIAHLDGAALLFRGGFC